MSFIFFDVPQKNYALDPAARARYDSGIPEAFIGALDARQLGFRVGRQMATLRRPGACREACILSAHDVLPSSTAGAKPARLSARFVLVRLPLSCKPAGPPTFPKGTERKLQCFLSAYFF
jgi:hypothetical protein